MPALPGTRFFYRVDGGEDNATALAATDWTEDVDGTFTGTDGEDYMAVAIGTSSIARNVNDITPAISGLQDLNASYASEIDINAAAAATGTNLVYSLTGPAWLSIDSGTGQITGTAPSSDVSTTATVTVRNAAGSASDSFAVSVTDASGLPDLAPITLPSSVIAAHDFTALSDLTGVTQADDITGNGNHLTFGATAPTLGFDADSGLRHHVFTASTDPLRNTGFFDRYDFGVGNNALLLVVELDDRTAGGGSGPNRLLGTDNGNFVLIASNDGYGVQVLNDAPTTLNDNDKYADRVDGKFEGQRLQTVRLDGTTRTVSGWAGSSYIGYSELTQSGGDETTHTVTSRATPTGDLVLNDKQIPGKIWGSIIMKDQTEAEFDQAVAYALRYWVAGPNRDRVVLFYGDSQTECAYPNTTPFGTMSPGWPAFLYERYKDRAFLQNYASAGQRIGTTAADPDFDASVRTPETLAAVLKNAKAWAQAFPGRVIGPVNYGYNDFADGASVAQISDSLEVFAGELATVGVTPVWMGCTQDYSRTNTDVLDQTVRDAIVAGSSNFEDVCDEWLLDSRIGFAGPPDPFTDYPEYMETVTAANTNGIHASGYGNAHKAELAYPFFDGLLDLTPVTSTRQQIADHPATRHFFDAHDPRWKVAADALRPNGEGDVVEVIFDSAGVAQTGVIEYAAAQSTQMLGGDFSTAAPWTAAGAWNVNTVQGRLEANGSGSPADANITQALSLSAGWYLLKFDLTQYVGGGSIEVMELDDPSTAKFSLSADRTWLIFLKTDGVAPQLTLRHVGIGGQILIKNMSLKHIDLPHMEAISSVPVQTFDAPGSRRWTLSGANALGEFSFVDINASGTTQIVYQETANDLSAVIYADNAGDVAALTTLGEDYTGLTA